MLIYKLIVLFNLIILIKSDEKFIEINTNDGIVRGQIKQTLFEEKEYFSFRGIPYAEPPLHKLRFLPPVKINKWKNTLDALDFQSDCTQIAAANFLNNEVNLETPGADNSKIMGSEDCLYLNVYTPDISPKEKLPVMFFIHGGAFLKGSGNDFIHGEEFLMEKDVILVTFNYRLHVYGFMSLGTEHYSGNMGIKDQVMALQWVNDNIKYFGGDTDKITVFGHSAGSIMSHLNVISLVSRNLFQRAILQSFTSFAPDVLDYKTDHKEIMMDFAEREGKNIKNTDELVEYLQTVDNVYLYKKIYERQLNIIPGRRVSNLIFKPVVEYENAVQPFLTDLPQNILSNSQNHNIDIMFGFVPNEFLFLSTAEAHDPTLFEEFDKDFEIFLPNREFVLDFESNVYKQMKDEVREFYFGDLDTPINNETFYEYIDLMSDTLFGVYALDGAVKRNFEKSDGTTYLYRFSIDAKLNILKRLNGLSDWSGTSHGDELCYIFKCALLNDEYKNLETDSLEKRTIDTMTTLWTNFAKFGNPTPNKQPIKWKRVKKSKMNFLDITNDGLILAHNPNFKMIQFWDKLFEKYQSDLEEENLNGKLVDEL